MYVTALLMLLLAISPLLSEKKKCKGLYSFDKVTTLPLRGLLAILILSHHLGQRTNIYLISQFTSGIGCHIVAVFFFISGYGLCVSYLSKGKNYMNGFLQKRLGKLLPKFLILTGGMVLLYHYFSSMDIGSQILKIASGWTPLPHSWFIYAIIYVYIAFYLCALISKSPKQTGILFTLANLAYIWITSKVLYFPSYWYMTILSVSLGYFVALYEKKVTEMLSHKFLCCTILAALSFVSFCAMSKNRVEFLSSPIMEIWILSQAISVYVIIRSLGFSQWKWLCQTGTFSLELYLIHGIPLMIGQYLGLNNWTLWLFTYALSIPSAILLNKAYDLMFHRNKLLEA